MKGEIMDAPKGFKEAFASLLEQRSRDKLREVFQQQIGETSQMDFKETWPDHPDLARHILALANSGGGCLIVGVAERADKSIDPVGLADIIDKNDIRKGIQKYLNDDTKTLVDISDFTYEAAEYNVLVGKKFQVLFVENRPDRLPHVCAKSNERKLREAAIYVRRGEQSIEANQSELDKILSTRIETSYSSTPELDLKHHVSQLKILYDSLPGPTLKADFFGMSSIVSMMYEKPYKPSEDFGNFLLKMIDRKKKRIEAELDQ